jgi:uncharacterized membrane protein YkvA (DUF1232 family)
MQSRMTSWLSKPGLIRTALSQLRLGVRLLREPGVPFLTKTVPVIAAVYLISPLDFIPDVIPVLGQLYDLAILVAGLELFVRLCPPAASTFHQDAIAHGRPYSPMAGHGDVIDAQWRRE